MAECFGFEISIEIIDLECALLSFLSKNLSPQNGGDVGNFGSSQSPVTRNFARFAGSEIFISHLFTYNLNMLLTLSVPNIYCLSLAL